MLKSTCMILLALAGSSAAFGAPQYTIIDLGVVSPGDSASQGTGISDGGIAYGRSMGSPTVGFTWTQSGGIVGLPNLGTHPFSVANGASDTGFVVGIGSTTAWGAGAVPLMWTGGTVTALPLPVGEGVGRAYGVNAAGVTVGSVGGGTTEYASLWQGGSVEIISATTGDGAFMRTAMGITNAGFVAGQGLDPNNAARYAGLLYNTNTGEMIEIPAGPGDNGTLPFAISQNNYVVGATQFNSGSGRPFIWSEEDGTVVIPLTPDASQGSARGVNSNGWVVGTGSGLYAVPFLYDGEQTYRLQDLIDPASGWDISTNTSSSAMGISEDGTIVGTGVFNGEIRAYAMVLIPSPGALSMVGLGMLAASRRRR